MPLEKVQPLQQPILYAPHHPRDHTSNSHATKSNATRTQPSRIQKMDPLLHYVHLTLHTADSGTPVFRDLLHLCLDQFKFVTEFFVAVCGKDVVSFVQGVICHRAKKVGLIQPEAKYTDPTTTNTPTPRSDLLCTLQ